MSKIRCIFCGCADPMDGLEEEPPSICCQKMFDAWLRSQGHDPNNFQF